MSSLFSHPQPIAFHDKAWKRADVADWDLRWTRLPLAARRFLLDTAAIGGNRPAPRIATASLAADVRNQLAVLGLLELDLDGNSGVPTAMAGLLVGRQRSLRRWALLGSEPSQFERYINTVFATYALGAVVADVVEKQTGLGRYRILGDVFDLFVRRHFWPEWVAAYLGDPLAGPMVARVEKDGPLPVSRLLASFSNHDPRQVRATFDRLVTHLALFEDIDANDLALMTGLMPEVKRQRQSQKLKREPALEPCQATEVGPEAGYEPGDLRAVLLEVSADRPRIKQDQSLFAKERERFLAALEPLPTWLNQDGEARLTNAMRWAFALAFVRAVMGPDKAPLLDLTAAGRSWLAQGREDQAEQMFAELRDPVVSALVPHVITDEAFLGSSIRALEATDETLSYRAIYHRMSSQERKPLRDAIHALVASLPMNTFFAVEQFLTWAGQPSRNPLNLGRPPSEVVVREMERIVPPLPEFLDETCRTLLRALIQHRLMGLGGVQMGRDEGGQLLFARLPRLDAYFGRPVERAAEPVRMLTRVVVQPDFSIIVIGADLAPNMALSPFCDRVRGGSTGSMTYRLSRESVFRALAGGLKGEEILARLRQHASTAIPANVSIELEAWCSQTRTVSVDSVTLLRCPDAETATRVLSVLGRQGERVGETAVALSGNLTPGLREKLRARGVIVQGGRERKKR